MKILLIIPTYNEADSILATYQKILRYNQEHGTDFHVIVINDGSRDNTGKICDDNQIPVVHLVQNLGIGGAVQTGYKYAKANGYDIAVQYDGDGQHEVAYVDTIVAPILKGEADMVIGSRFVGDLKTFQSSALRRFGIRIISMMMKLMTGKKVHDTTSGFRACNKEIIQYFAEQYPHEYPEPITTTEVLCRGFRVTELPVEMWERQGGISSIRAWKTVYYMINVCLSLLVIKLGGTK